MCVEGGGGGGAAEAQYNVRGWEERRPGVELGFDPHYAIGVGDYSVRPSCIL